MRSNLRRRLERLIERDPSTAGRMIVVSIDAARVNDADLVQATLAGAGVERGASDLLVLVKKYGGVLAHTGCALVSISALAGQRRAERPPAKALNSAC